jgi:hypothetical protein
MEKFRMELNHRQVMALDFVEKNVKKATIAEATIFFDEKLTGFTPCEMLYIASALSDEAIKQLEENQVHGLGQSWVEVAKLVKQTIVTVMAFMCDVQEDAKSKVTVCTIVDFTVKEIVALEKILSEFNSIEANTLKKYLKYLELVMNAIKTAVCLPQ